MNANLSDILSLFLDPLHLSKAVDASRVAIRVRIKPGVSVSASLTDANDLPVDWVHLL